MFTGHNSVFLLCLMQMPSAVFADSKACQGHGLVEMQGSIIDIPLPMILPIVTKALICL